MKFNKIKNIIKLIIFIYYLFNSTIAFCQETRENNFYNFNEFVNQNIYLNFNNIFDVFQLYKYSFYVNFYFKKLSENENSLIFYNTSKIYNNNFLLELKNSNSFLIYFKPNLDFGISIAFGYFSLNYSSKFFSGIKSIFPVDLKYITPKIYFSYNIFNFYNNYNSFFNALEKEKTNYFLNIYYANNLNMFFGIIRNNDNKLYYIYGIYLKFNNISLFFDYETHNYEIKIYDKIIERFNRFLFSINLYINELALLIELPYTLFYYMDYPIYYLDFLLIFKLKNFKYLLIFKGFNYKSENYYYNNYVNDIYFKIFKYIELKIYIPFDNITYKILSEDTFIKIYSDINFLKRKNIVDNLNLYLEIQYFPKNRLKNENYFIFTNEKEYYRIEINPDIKLKLSKNIFISLFIIYKFYNDYSYNNKFGTKLYLFNNLIYFSYYENKTEKKQMYIFNKYTMYDFNYIYVYKNQKVYEIGFENENIFNSLFLKFIIYSYDKINKIYFMAGFYYAR